MPSNDFEAIDTFGFNQTNVIRAEDLNKFRSQETRYLCHDEHGQSNGWEDWRFKRIVKIKDDAEDRKLVSKGIAEQ